MMVDNAYSNEYGYISGATIGVDVDFSLYDYWSLEQICAERWCPSTQCVTSVTGKWEGTFQILTVSRIKGEVDWEEFGRAEAGGSISIWILQKGVEIKGFVKFYNVQESIKFDNAAFGEYIVMFSTLEGTFECAGTVNADGSLTITQFVRYSQFKANVAGDAVSASFEETFVSEMDEFICLKRSGGKIETVIGPTETKDIVTFNLRRVSDEPPFLGPHVPTPAATYHQ
ncbi:MAG: hypothetical protein N0A00_08360 [Candidatus Bathyarchaeota archaeon]|nr:hypothetical protein [Candidatus Bathyarchaeota archaeon]